MQRCRSAKLLDELQASEELQRFCRGKEVLQIADAEVQKFFRGKEVQKYRGAEVCRGAEVERLRDKEVQRGRCRYSSTLGAEGQRHRDAEEV